MKKTMVILAAVLLLPGGMVLAERGGGDGGGSRGGDREGGGGWSGGSSTANNGGRDSGSSRSDNSTNDSKSTARFSSGYHSYSNSTRSNGARSSNGYSNYRNRGNNPSWNGNQRNFNSSNRSGSGSVINGNQSRFNANTQRIPSNLKAMGVNRMPLSKMTTQMPGHSGNRPALVVPKSGPGGTALRAKLLTPGSHSASAQSRISSFVNNQSIRSQVNGFNSSERRVGNYYWHNWNGRNFCHYYDGCYNWYGWYFGGSCFWSCYYGYNWWWYDPGYSRWCYWNDGYWWWQNPYNVNATYLYNNGDYVPADQASDNGSNDNYAKGSDNNYDQPSMANGEEQPARLNEPAASQGQAPQEGVIQFRSKNNNRTVKVMGDAGDAFLYDTAAKSFKPVYLETGVTGVRFDGSGKNMKIQLTLQNGKVETFKANGDPVKDL